MLITSLLIFLKQLLPPGFVFLFYFSLNPAIKFSINLLIKYLMVSLLFFSLYYWLQVYDVLNFKQKEFLTITFFSLFVLLSMFLLLQKNKATEEKNYLRIWSFSTILISTIYISNLLFYLFNLNLTEINSSSFFMGLFIGLGTCLSVMTLGYFIFNFFIRTHKYILVEFLFRCFVAGQSLHIVNSLLLMDILPSQQALWNSGSFIQENSEWGYFLSSFIGYESTPTIWHLVFYLGILIIPLVAQGLGRKYQKKSRRQNEL